MNNEAKVLLTINLEGGTLIKGKPEVRKYFLTKKDMFPSQSFKGDAGKKIIKSGKYKYTPTTLSEAKQKIVIGKDTYDYMISANCPQWYRNPKEWQNRFSATKRLEMHLARICESLRGLSFSYKLIED